MTTYRRMTKRRAPSWETENARVLVAILTCLALSQAQAQSPPQTYPCNNDHYVNSVGHTVHSPSCGWEPVRKPQYAAMAA